MIPMRTFMQSRACRCMLFLCVAGMASCSAAVRPGQQQKRPSALELEVPENAADRTYLGIEEGTRFHVSEIAAQVVIIELFSTLCHHCQKEAPRVNELYALIAREGLAGSIKIIGIGEGNTPGMVRAFREKYAVPFPLFADKKMAVMDALHARLLPAFFCFRRGRDGSFEQFYSLSRDLGSPANVLKAVRTHSGMKGRSAVPPRP